MSDRSLDYRVTGYGTGGTVTGVARVLRRERPATRIVLTEPENAQLLGSGQAQERAGDGSPRGSHPAWEPHPIQGWTPDFVPLVLQEAIDDDLYDELQEVSDRLLHDAGGLHHLRQEHLGYRNKGPSVPDSMLRRGGASRR